MRFFLPIAATVVLVLVAVPLLFFRPSAEATPNPDRYPMPAEINEVYDRMVGRPAPEIITGEWFNSEPKTLADYRGQIVLLDAWATWCAPCLQAIPHNNEIARQYADEGVAVLGISTSSQGQELTGEAVRRFGIEYPVATDPTLETMENYNVEFFPTYAVIDRKGVLREIGVRPDRLEQVISDIIAEQPAEHPDRKPETADESDSPAVQG